jgi:hypothetical protein
MSKWKHVRTYPDQRPGSGWFEDRERRLEIREEERERRSWRDDARDKGISAYSFDDYCEKLEALRDDDLMSQALHEAERKCTDAQLCGLPEPEQHECANCGRTGPEEVITEAKRKCGTGYGEWYCRTGLGCQVKR